MLSRLSALLVALIVVAPAAAQTPAKEAPPAVVIRMRSLNAFVEDVDLLMTLAGRQELGKQVEGLIKAKTGAHGLVGVDMTRPLGGYAAISPDLDGVSGAVLIPVADEKAFLGLLESLDLKLTKEKDDIYSAAGGGTLKLFLRFANKYAYVSAFSPAGLSVDKLPEPGPIVGKADGAALAVHVRVDKMPELAKGIALAQLDQEIQAVKSQLDSMIPATHRDFLTAGIDEAGRMAARILKQGGEISFEFDIDRVAKELTSHLSLTGMPDSELAKNIANLGQLKNLFGGLRAKQPALVGDVRYLLPESVRKALVPVLDEARAKALDSIHDSTKNKLAKTMLDGLIPGLESGDLEGSMALMGPSDEHYTLLLAMKIPNGAKVGETIKKIIIADSDVMPLSARDRIHLDEASVDGIAIHHLAIPAEAGDANFDRLIGDGNFYIAFRDDALFMTLGKDGIAAIKTALALRSPTRSPVFVYEMDMARMIDTFETNEKKQQARKVFQPGQNNRFSLTVDGGLALSMHLSVPLNVIQFYNQPK